MKKNILLLDTNISAKPIYDFLLSTNNYVYVAGANQNDALAKSAVNYCNIDYSNVAEVERIIHEYSIDFLVPGGNDLSYKICSEINEKYKFFNIDSVETNEVINNKEKFRGLAIKLGLHTPQIISATDQFFIDKPIIVKPIDAFSGHGITVLNNPENESVKVAIQRAEKHSKTGKHIIEDFVEGQLYSHSAFITDNKIIADFIVEEHCIVNKFAVDTSKVVFDFDSAIMNSLRNDILRLVAELNLQDGLIHTQFISNSKNFWIIEVTRRCPGDLYSLLIELSTGFPYAATYTKPFLGLKNDQQHTIERKALVFRHTISIQNKMNIHSINYNFPFKQIKFFPYSLTGDIVQESPYGRVGILFGAFNNNNEFNEIYQSVINRTLYTFE
jgi:carbamoylphosphate synthase large subunit